MSDRPRTYSVETREEALKMHAAGIKPISIAARMSIPLNVIKYWIDYEDLSTTKRPPIKAKTKSGSGVIAPPAYRYGYRWSIGSLT